MTKLEKLHADFDGLRKVLQIRSKKKILAAIDNAYKIGDCPLSALRRQVTKKVAKRLDEIAYKEHGNVWFSDWNYSFSPHTNGMATWWGDSSPTTHRRYLTQLRKFYE